MTLPLGWLIALLMYVLFAWVLLSVITGVGVYAYLHRQNEPAGWRFNHHGASYLRGHLSFYERDGGRAVLLRATLIPTRWKVCQTPEPGAYNLETVRTGAVWDVVPFGFRHMWNLTALSVIEGGSSE